jgi:predicted HicB family RNase H-like nuclease
MTTMTHDGYVALIELDEEAGLFHGEVIDTRDVLTFQGRTLDENGAPGEEAARAPIFRPFHPAPGPDLHRRVATAAARERKSVNAFIAEALGRVA